MENKFISQDAFQKRKTRENKSSSKYVICLVKQREYKLRKKSNESAEEQKICITYDKERKHVKYNESRFEFIMTTTAAKFSE
ncbi:hypothetical protein RCL_jg27536.t1 [Rhizophagus clarus]|uniref:Uncharacterized protein n=1 Tax=Rhizophagus clarus TaxID=94130 RepID=A0A8H3QVU5_9GLOM|nr:hypothetical protein RCL_jg27536.t1 [Rhizophagus clarus]